MGRLDYPSHIQIVSFFYVPSGCSKNLPMNKQNFAPPEPQDKGEDYNVAFVWQTS